MQGQNIQLVTHFLWTFFPPTLMENNYLNINSNAQQTVRNIATPSTRLAYFVYLSVNGMAIFCLWGIVTQSWQSQPHHIILCGRTIAPKPNYQVTVMFLFQNHPQRYMNRNLFVIIWDCWSQLQNVHSNGIWTRTFGIPVRRFTCWNIESTGIEGEIFIPNRKDILATT